MEMDPIEPPVKHLEFRDKPLSLLGGAATINVPALMHTYPTEHPDRVLDLGLHNVSGMHRISWLSPDHSVADGKTFDEFQKLLPSVFKRNTRLKAPSNGRRLAKNRRASFLTQSRLRRPDQASGRKQKHAPYSGHS